MLALEQYNEIPCIVQHVEDWERELIGRYTCLEEVTFVCECGQVQTVRDVMQQGKPKRTVCTECIHCHQTSDQLTKGGRLIVLKGGHTLPIFDFASEKT